MSRHIDLCSAKTIISTSQVNKLAGFIRYDLSQIRHVNYRLLPGDLDEPKLVITFWTLDL
jgi:hypothetical protein